MTTLRANIAALILATLGLTAMLFGCASQTGPRPTAEQPQPPLTAISSVVATSTPDEVRVSITADGPLTFSSLKQPDPRRGALLPETTVEQTEVVQAGRYRSDHAHHRATGQWKDHIPHRGAAGGRRALHRRSGRQHRANQLRSFGRGPRRGRPGGGTRRRTRNGRTTRHHRGGTTQGGTAWVNKIDFLSESDGKSTLVVGTTRPVDFRIHKTGAPAHGRSGCSTPAFPPIASGP
jgi:hypothetical protein